MKKQWSKKIVFIAVFLFVFGAHAKIYNIAKDTVKITQSVVVDGELVEVSNPKKVLLILKREGLKKSGPSRDDPRNPYPPAYLDYEVNRISKLDGGEFTATILGGKVKGFYLEIMLRAESNHLPFLDNKSQLVRYRVKLDYDKLKRQGLEKIIGDFEFFLTHHKGSKIKGTVHVTESIDYREHYNSILSPVGAYDFSRLTYYLKFDTLLPNLVFWADFKSSIEDIYLLEKTGLFKEVISSKTENKE